ncbi:manganese efflux pump [Viridibacillus sp. YIM B01967]|uniref:Manganese efflux pump n=1 Tax=Viridibacillus soli TaxID=2798301 RepID=A0ABS1H967_9BACL|nr:manganese efflux pump [Viridibacillus soli]MBK3495642.1 manganese efflux pump [Viridibacillus soli]
MQEIIAGIITALDVLALYLILPKVRFRFALSCWTAGLHVLFPLIGFQVGEWAAQYLLTIAKMLSGVLLALIGLQLLLSAKVKEVPKLSPMLLAVTASLDTFSVSVSFGMLQLQEGLFIMSTGITTFLFSYIALSIKRKTPVDLGIMFQVIAGVALLLIGILSIFQ